MDVKISLITSAEFVFRKHEKVSMTEAAIIQGGNSCAAAHEFPLMQCIAHGKNTLFRWVFFPWAMHCIKVPT